jgi:hypothetical protein
MEDVHMDEHLKEKGIPNILDHIVLKASFTKDERELKVKADDISFDTLYAILYELYPQTTDNLMIKVIKEIIFLKVKYRDDDGDMVTIGCDHDLSESLKWISQKKSQDKTLHLFVLTQNEDHNILLGVTNLFLKLSLSDPKKGETHSLASNYSILENKVSLLMKGSQWEGTCNYPDGLLFFCTYFLIISSSNFPFAIRFDNCEDKTIEGIISWKSLNAVTKFLGLLVGENNFKFTEYEVEYCLFL